MSETIKLSELTEVSTDQLFDSDKEPQFPVLLKSLNTYINYKASLKEFSDFILGTVKNFLYVTLDQVTQKLSDLNLEDYLKTEDILDSIDFSDYYTKDTVDDLLETLKTNILKRINALTANLNYSIVSIYRLSDSYTNTFDVSYKTSTLYPPEDWVTSIDQLSAEDGIYIWQALARLTSSGFYKWEDGSIWSSAVCLGLYSTTASTNTAIFYSTIYKTATSIPDTPTGGSYDFSTFKFTAPSGWSETIPTTTPIWESHKHFYEDPLITEPWSSPTRKIANALELLDEIESVYTSTITLYIASSTEPELPTITVSDCGMDADKWVDSTAPIFILPDTCEWSLDIPENEDILIWKTTNSFTSDGNCTGWTGPYKYININKILASAETTAEEEALKALAEAKTYTDDSSANLLSTIESVLSTLEAADSTLSSAIADANTSITLTQTNLDTYKDEVTNTLGAYVKTADLNGDNTTLKTAVVEITDSTIDAKVLESLLVTLDTCTLNLSGTTSHTCTLTKGINYYVSTDAEDASIFTLTYGGTTYTTIPTSVYIEKDADDVENPTSTYDLVITLLEDGDTTELLDVTFIIKYPISASLSELLQTANNISVTVLSLVELNLSSEDSELAKKVTQLVIDSDSILQVITSTSLDTVNVSSLNTKVGTIEGKVETLETTVDGLSDKYATLKINTDSVAAEVAQNIYETEQVITIGNGSYTTLNLTAGKYTIYNPTGNMDDIVVLTVTAVLTLPFTIEDNNEAFITVINNKSEEVTLVVASIPTLTLTSRVLDVESISDLAIKYVDGVYKIGSLEITAEQIANLLTRKDADGNSTVNSIILTLTDSENTIELTSEKIVLNGETIAKAIAAKSIDIDGITHIYGTESIYNEYASTDTEHTGDKFVKANGYVDGAELVDIGLGTEGEAHFYADGSGSLAGGLITWDRYMLNADGGLVYVNKKALTDESAKIALSIQGIILATGGTIGGWTLTDSELYKKSGTNSIHLSPTEGIVSTTSDTNNWELLADGTASFANGKVLFNNDGTFRFNKSTEDSSDGIYYDGTNFTIGGGVTLTATKGTIGGFTIDENRLYYYGSDSIGNTYYVALNGSRSGLSLSYTKNSDLIKNKIYISPIDGIYTNNGSAINWRFNIDGSGQLALNNVKWDTNGNVTVSGEIAAKTFKLNNAINSLTTSDLEDGIMWLTSYGIAKALISTILNTGVTVSGLTGVTDETPVFLVKSTSDSGTSYFILNPLLFAASETDKVVHANTTNFFTYNTNKGVYSLKILYYVDDSETKETSYYTNSEADDYLETGSTIYRTIGDKVYSWHFTTVYNFSDITSFYIAKGDPPSFHYYQAFTKVTSLDDGKLPESSSLTFSVCLDNKININSGNILYIPDLKNPNLNDLKTACVNFINSVTVSEGEVASGTISYTNTDLETVTAPVYYYTSTYYVNSNTLSYYE